MSAALLLDLGADGLTIEDCSTWAPDYVSAIRRHYPGSRGAPPGRKLGCRVRWDGRVIAWWGLGEPSYKLAARRALGLADARPAPRTVANFFFRAERLPDAPAPSSSALIRALLVHSLDAWARRYGSRPEHIETLVDAASVASEIPGYCYRRAGFRPIGHTTGRGARRPEGSSRGPRVWGETSVRVVLYRGPLARGGTR